jgi:arylsulfatase A-like enzyme
LSSSSQLAAQSLVFRNGYVPSSLCCPSLAQIMTGKYAHQNRITSNDPPAKGKGTDKFLEGRQWMANQMTQQATIARYLARLGYRSFQTGKWWFGDFRAGGFTHGMSKGGRHGDAGLVIGRNTMQPIFDFIADARKADKPFFIWYAPMLPHTPHNAPERIVAKYKNKTKSLFEARYWANVEWFDETCGQLLDHLQKQGLDENTIVIYLTDNGWIQNPLAGGPLRSKLTQYAAGHHTPIMIRWPGKVNAETVEQPVSSIDILPTILKAVDLEPAKDLQGLNLLDRTAVTTRKAIFGADFTHDAIDLEHPDKSTTHRWVIEDRWRLIIPYRKGQVELYNLANDPGEARNLAAEQPERVRDLTQKLDAWWTPE